MARLELNLLGTGEKPKEGCLEVKDVPDLIKSSWNIKGHTVEDSKIHGARVREN